jgi:hypothetical protein
MHALAYRPVDVNSCSCPPDHWSAVFVPCAWSIDAVKHMLRGLPASRVEKKQGRSACVSAEARQSLPDKFARLGETRGARTGKKVQMAAGGILEDALCSYQRGQ